MSAELTINGKLYREVDTSGEAWRIVVLDRGFVVVGRVSIADSYITICECACVRKWGTTRGLGQLASEGPTSTTVLDPQPTTRVHELQVVQMIDTEGSLWNQ